MVSGALACAAAARGKQVCLAEVAGSETQAALFDADPVGYIGGPLAPSIRGVSINPADAVEEYLVRMLRFRLLYELVFRNRYIAPFLNGVMGLSDLITVGKVMDLEWEGLDGPADDDPAAERRYDLVVVDGPATGHGVSLLRAPQAMMDVTRVGPLHANAKLIRDLLADRDKTAVVLVTLAEEMPVNETIELARALADRVDVQVAGVVVNAVAPPLLTGPAADAWPAVAKAGRAAGGDAAAAVEDAARAIRDRERADGYVHRLRDELALPVLELPLLSPGDIGADGLGTLATALEAWL